MKYLLTVFAALCIFSALCAENMRLSDSIPCKYLGALYYGGNVGYQLSFETGTLNLSGRKGEGNVVTVTVVVPRKGHKSNALPEGEFLLGTKDSLAVNTIDYYESSVRHYASAGYEKPDVYLPFTQCRMTIFRQKRGYEIHIYYTLTNGESGELSYVGKVKMRKFDSRAKFNFMPEKRYIKNWQLTEAKLKVIEGTAFSSRRATLTFLCADEIFGMVVLYLPTDSIAGHYVMRRGKEAGSCEISAGGYDADGYFNLFNTGIEEESSGYIYYPESGHIDISDGKLFFEFVARDGSIVRGVYKGKISE